MGLVNAADYRTFALNLNLPFVIKNPRGVKSLARVQVS